MTRELRPPSGMPPPETATLPDGTEVALRPLAERIADLHLAEHPDEVDRYGDAGRAWCVHDNQHLLNWAAQDVAGGVDLLDQVGWLASVLAARGYPIDRLADDLRTAAAVLSDAHGETARPVCDRLTTAAGTVAPAGGAA